MVVQEFYLRVHFVCVLDSCFTFDFDSKNEPPLNKRWKAHLNLNLDFDQFALSFVAFFTLVQWEEEKPSPPTVVR